jgi:hypothetical protein
MLRRVRGSCPVLVLTGGDEGSLDLDEACIVEFEARVPGADEGEVVPAATVLAKRRGGR